MAFFALGDCVSCGQPFSFNPDLVPSIRVKRVEGRLVPDPAGEREPVCQQCVERANEQRAQKGLPPLPVLPGAYEAQPEETDEE